MVKRTQSSFAWLFLVLVVLDFLDFLEFLAFLAFLSFFLLLDDIAGSPDALAALMPNARVFAIEGRDHMLSVGDRTFKAEVLRFLGAAA